VALIVALSGTAVAASHYIITSTSQIKPSVLRALHARTGVKGTPALAGTQGPPGPPGVPGPAGAQGVAGPLGPAGVQGPQGVPGDARAYALLRPPCTGCELGLNFSPLVAAQSKNVALASPKGFYGTPAGTWCFVLEGGIDPSTATVIASPVATEDTRNSAIGAQWVPYAPNCAANQIEIRTFTYAIAAGKVIEEPSGFDVPVSFSFVVP
jgi:Collagen triple helix repeat (20 copies)